MSFLKGVKGIFIKDDATPPPTPGGDSADSIGEDLDRLIGKSTPTPGPKTATATAAPSHVRPVTPSAPVVTSTDVTEGTPFPVLYKEQGVTDQPYTAEQLLKVVDGLKGVPKEQVLLTLNAMDAADDRWTLDDVLLDAANKINVLKSGIDVLNAKAAKADQECDASTASSRRMLSEFEAEIARQIAELEAQREAARQESAQEQSGAISKRDAIKAAVGREVTRLKSEAERLGQIPSLLNKKP